MRIVADERIAALDPTFGRHGEVIKVDGRAIGPALLENAQALITRTVTAVDRWLLEGSAVRFVGTATIGSDHLDTAWLDAANIRWTAAPGCNADATAQYTLAMYLMACKRLSLDPLARRFGIIGCGNVGRRLKHMLEALGIETVPCDPPLAAQGSPGFRPMAEVLSCEVVSLHVPLTRTGRWPTYRMFYGPVFDRLSTETLLINASRGNVIDGRALKAWLARGGQAALDVWPDEPEIDTQTLEKAVVATPHIAGYSLDGKYRASATVYRAFCRFFGLEPGPSPEPPPIPAPDQVNLQDKSFMKQLLKACPVERDDAAMRTLLAAPKIERAQAFERLRSIYPLRRDLVL